MATVAAGAAGSAACCAVEACACFTCSSLMSCCCRGSSSSNGKGPSSRLAKVFYLMVIVFSVVVALILRYYGGNMFVHLSSFEFGCKGDKSADTGFQSKCFGNQAVYRISFALAAWFAVMALGSMSTQFHRGYWGLKLGMYAILGISSFFIPNTFFNTYADIARVVSVVFLLLMVVILIDFAYSLQEGWEEKASELDERVKADGYEEVGICQNGYRMLYLAVAFILVAVSLGGIIGLYSFSTNTKTGCGTNVGLLSMTLIIGLIYMVISPLEVCGARGLVPPAVVWSYSVWLLWSAFTANPDTDCNPLGTKDDSATQIIIGLLITALSLAYTAYSASNALPGFCGGGNDDEDGASASLLHPDETTKKVLTGDIETAEELAEERERVGTSESGASRRRNSEEEDDGVGEHNWMFHLIMFTASLYMAMLLTDWGKEATSISASGESHTAMWVKIISQWCVFGVYAWTLMAPACGPRCCPGREWS